MLTTVESIPAIPEPSTHANTIQRPWAEDSEIVDCMFPVVATPSPNRLPGPMSLAPGARRVRAVRARAASIGVGLARGRRRRTFGRPVEVGAWDRAALEAAPSEESRDG